MTDGDADGVAALLAERLDALAGEVRELGRRVTTNEAGLLGLGTAVSEAAGLAQEVQRLAEKLGGAGDGGAGAEMGTAHPRRPPWRWMSDEQYRDALRDLARWVTEVLLTRYRYTLAVLPACWPAHPEAVEELDVLYWLWVGWAVPPGEAASAARDAADWHDRWLPGALARLGPVLRHCHEGGQHVRGPGWLRPVPAGAAPPGAVVAKHWPELLLIDDPRADLREAPRPGGTPRGDR